MDASQQDGLTGFLTRKVFLEQLNQELARSIQSGQALSLAAIDIDSFKLINDEHGHQVGDEVLASLAQAIRQQGGENLIGGRYGGDEFLLLFPALEREAAFLLLESIRAKVQGLNIPSASNPRVNIPLTISGGLSSLPMDGRTVDELLRNAEQALYRAKVSGRNRIRMSYEEKMVPKTTHFTQTQLERLSKLAEEAGVSEAVLLREALDDLLRKYQVTMIDG